jgi:hypothetical protein
MTTRFRFVLWSLFVALVAFMVAPKVRADGWNKETVVTFSHPIEVPGEVLPAGTYVFKLLSNEGHRRIVQIFSEDQTKLLATVMAIPDYRLVATEKPVISFEERPSGSPEAVGSWFYPGDNHGVRFVYPNLRMALGSNSQPAATPAPPPAEATTIPAPPAAEAITTPIEASVQREQERQIVGQERPLQPIERVPSSLPKTAANFMALPLAGFGLLFAGATMLRGARTGVKRE